MALDSVEKLLLEQEVNPRVEPASVKTQASVSRCAFLNFRRAANPINPKPNNAAKAIGEDDVRLLAIVEMFVLIVTVTDTGFEGSVSMTNSSEWKTPLGSV